MERIQNVYGNIFLFFRNSSNFTQFTELVEKYFCLGKIQEICAIERKGHI